MKKEGNDFMFLSSTRKRILAFILCIAMTLSGVSAVQGGVYAMEGDEGFATSTDASLSADEEASVDESLPVNSELGLNFAVVEEARFDTPFENKYIVVDMGEEGTSFDSASIVLLNKTTGAEYTFEASNIVGTSILFYISFADESFSGKYIIEKVLYEAGGVSYEKVMSDEDVTPMFGVNTDIDEEPTGWLSDEPETDPEVDKYITDYSDSFTNAKVIGAGLGKANNSSDSKVFSVAPENVVVVLDPGHGGSDTGACYTWNGVLYCERDINQTIANACYEELKKYSNVTVYMTRSSASEPLHGSVGQDLQWRCDYAHDVGADLFVSLHCNASVSPNARKGAEVYIPNSGYNAQVYNVGKTVGETIGSKLTALGLTNGATYTRGSANGSTYPDGTTSDYYAVIKHNKEYGIPGLIVEHGYINNSSDALTFFYSNAKIKELGIADAQAIAANLGLLEQNRVAGNSNPTGWRKNGNEWVYFKDGNVCTGFFEVSGKYYYAKSNGSIVTGWQLIKGDWYCFNDSGEMIVSTWLKDKSGRWSFLMPDGKMATGVTDVYGTTYVFNGDGIMLTGWQQVKNDWYYTDSSGAAYKEKWLQGSKGEWYYFDGKSKMATGWVKSGGVNYYMGSDGVMQTGWIQDGNSWSYADKSGAVKKDAWMQSSKGYWYYFDGDCKMLTGWVKLGSTYYYMSSSGEMQTGWLYVDGVWYLTDKDGAVYMFSWVKSDKGDWYYFNGSCKMVTGKNNIGGTMYYMAETGEMKTGWFKKDNDWYYADENGALVWNNWLQDGKNWYYFDKDCKMVTTSITIGDKTYFFDDNGLYTYTLDKKDAEKLHPIMGSSSFTAAQLAARFKSEKMEYPKDVLGAGGAADIDTFCKIIVEEANAEGVKAEVVYSQIMVETGWLRFGGSVKPEQYNFCGLGATSQDDPGESFKDVRTGIRAQVQHLKAYACSDSLKKECVDTRFKYVERGCAPYVEYLGIQENPSKKGWATAKGYGASLLKVMTSFK